MKKNLIIILCFLSFRLNAQTPQRISYQAIIRNASNALVVNQSIGMKISLLKGSSTGTSVFVETHNPVSNSNGLVSIEIGGGTVQSGVFSSIDWATGVYYVQVEVDPNGGTNYTISGANQLLSVPYALYAQKAANGFTHYIGENFGGGIVFHLWKDNAGVEYGLVVDITDIASNVNLSNAGNSNATSHYDGLNNSNNLTFSNSNSGSAPDICLNATSQGQTDWYLPSINELVLIYNNIFTVNNALSQVSGAVLINKTGDYYSSTVRNASTSYYFNFTSGQIQVLSQQFQNIDNQYVRAIRAF